MFYYLLYPLFSKGPIKGPIKDVRAQTVSRIEFLNLPCMGSFDS